MGKPKPLPAVAEVPPEALAEDRPKKSSDGNQAAAPR